MKGRLKHQLADTRRPKSGCKQAKILTYYQATASTLKLDEMEQKQEEKMGRTPVKRQERGNCEGRSLTSLFTEAMMSPLRLLSKMIMKTMYAYRYVYIVARARPL